MTHGIRRHDLPALWLTRTPTGPEWAPWGVGVYTFSSAADALRHASILGIRGAEVVQIPSPADAVLVTRGTVSIIGEWA